MSLLEIPKSTNKLSYRALGDTNKHINRYEWMNYISIYGVSNKNNTLAQVLRNQIWVLTKKWSQNNSFFLETN